MSVILQKKNICLRFSRTPELPEEHVNVCNNRPLPVSRNHLRHVHQGDPTVTVAAVKRSNNNISKPLILGKRKKPALKVTDNDDALDYDTLALLSYYDQTPDSTPIKSLPFSPSQVCV